MGQMKLRNSRSAVIFLSFVSIALGGISLNAGAETFEEALGKAYLSNPTLRAARAQLRATDERVPQALSGWRPTVELSYDYGKSNNFSNTPNSATRSQNRTPKNGALTVEQNLFQGFQTETDTKVAEADVLAQRARLSSTEQNVLRDAATAYMDVVRDEAVLNLNLNNERVLARQLQATRDRFEVGEVTRTDVAQAEARLSSAKAETIQADGALVRSRARYRQIIGDAPGTLKAPPLLSDLPLSEDDAINRARDSSPDVIAARFDEQSARLSIKSSEAELYPTLDLVGELNRRDQAASPESRTEEASITAQVTVPLYQAGAVSSRIREAKQVWNQRRRELDVANLAVTRGATDAWKNLETARAQIRAFTAAVRAGQIALEGVRQEAQVGSRTVLDVLDAEQELLDARVSLVRAERDALVASVDLRQAVGSLLAKELKLPTELYDPEDNYRAVRNKWFGFEVKEE
jgi:outer membrane protein